MATTMCIPRASLTSLSLELNKNLGYQHNNYCILITVNFQIEFSETTDSNNSLKIPLRENHNISFI